MPPEDTTNSNKETTTSSTPDLKEAHQAAAEPVITPDGEVIHKDVEVDPPAGVKFSDFVQERDGASPIATKPTEEKPTKEVAPKKVEDTEKPKLEIEENELEAVQAAPVGKPKQEPFPRDFTGMTEEETNIFKNMSVPAYKKLKPIYEEYKKLKANPPVAKADPNGLPPNYYSNPNAFVLSPKYQEVSSALSAADLVKKHWEEQELNIKYNGKWKDLDIKDGKFVVGPDQDADMTSEKFVREAYQFANKQYQKHESEHSKFVDSFKARQSEASTKVSKIEADFFPTMDGGEKDATKEMREQIVKTLPEEYQESVPISLFTKTGAALALNLALVKELKAENAKLKGIKADSSAAPPTKKGFIAATTRNNGGLPKFSDFQKERMNG
jgi:hypothetical protein